MSQDHQFSRHFSPQARKALLLAQEAAQYFQQDHIDTEHLLLGLLRTPQSDAVKILHHMHIDAERVQQEVGVMAQRGESVTSKVEMTTQAQEAIRLAIQAAKDLGYEFIGTGHMLLGLLSLEEGLAVTVLTSLGASLERAHKLISQKQPETALNREQQQRAHAYRNQINKLSFLYVICLAVLFGFLYAFLEPMVSFATSIEQASLLNMLFHIQPVSGWFPGSVLFFYLFILVFLVLIFFPFYWYVGLVLPRSKGLVNMTTRDWLKRQAKSQFRQEILGLCFVELSFFLMAIQPYTWWLWASMITCLYTLVMMRIRPVLALKRRSSSLITLPLSGELEQQIRALLERLHVSLRGILIMKVSDKTSGANAYFTGWGRGQYVILTDTLLQQFTPNEIEVIVAHELGHMVHRDIWKKLFIKALLMVGTLFLFSRLYSPLSGWNLQFVGGFLPLILLVLSGLYLVILRQYRAYQRRSEYQADEFALQATGKIQAFKNAFTRMTNINMSVAHASNYDRRRSTHPDLAQRLRHADEFAARQRATAQASFDSQETVSS
jgi:STE24 endopeptidase